MPTFRRVALPPSLLPSLLLTAGLCASATYWALPFLKPAPRPLAPPPAAVAPAVDIAAAQQLFGQSAVAASNFQLRGIMLADRAGDSVAVVAADGKPARAGRVGSELGAGVRILEIHDDYVLLSDHGVQQRVTLPPRALPRTPG